MKSKYIQLLLGAFILITNLSVAQVSSYVFSQFTGTYIPLTVSGGTTVATGFQDDNVYGNVPIGFSFVYNNITYTAVGLSSNGWMSFGGNVPNDNFTPISNSWGNGVSYMSEDMQLGPYQTCTITSGSNVIAFSNPLASNFFVTGDVVTGTGIPASTSVVATGAGNMTISANATSAGTAVTTAGRISYATTGVTPNRIFTLQFRQIGRWNNNGTGQDDYVNAQIKLYETSNVVEIVYGYTGTNNSNVLFAEVGLAGQNSTDYNNRQVAVGNNWLSSTAGFANSAKCVMSNSNTIPFGLTYRWTPPSPCTGTPAANTAIASTTLACMGGDAFLNLAQSYTLSGLNFMWSASTNSTGPFTPVNTFTNGAYTATNITTNTWFICNITCTNSSLTYTTAPLLIASVPNVTSTVPYFEGFENVPHNNVLPNCSWLTSNPSVICQTYTLNNTYNRVPNTGSKFASFNFGTNSNGDYFYTNGIWLHQGYTYSAAVNYITDGNAGWTEFGIHVGTNQSTVGLQSIASVTGNVTNTTYTVLSGTFSVASSGIYYIAVKAIGSNNPWYLSWDDLSVTAPCNFNLPTVLISGGNGSYCENAAVTLTANGANSYTWNIGPNPNSPTLQTTAILNFNYNVVGANLVNCIGSAMKTLTVLPLPSLMVTPATQTVCVNQTATINVSGGSTYTWNPSNHQSATFTLTPTSNYNFTVVSTGTNGCINTATAALIIDPCTGLNEITNLSSIKIYPNPASSYLHIEKIDAEKTEWKITDLSGKIILQGTLINGNGKINIETISKGIYLLELQSETKFETRKIIKD